MDCRSLRSANSSKSILLMYSWTAGCICGFPLTSISQLNRKATLFISCCWTEISWSIIITVVWSSWVYEMKKESKKWAAKFSYPFLEHTKSLMKNCELILSQTIERQSLSTSNVWKMLLTWIFYKITAPKSTSGYFQCMVDNMRQPTFIVRFQTFAYQSSWDFLN